MPPPTPSLPPQVPTRSLAPVMLALGGGLVLVGLVVWKLTQSSEPAPKPKIAPMVAAQPAPVPAAVPAPEPPPPPPPEEEVARPTAARAPISVPAEAKPDLTPKGAPMTRDPDCDPPCNGKESPQLLSAIGAKAGQARSCYEKALSNNNALAGRLEVAVRVSRTGSVCSASVGKDGLGDASVTSCVLSRFRGGKYPQPSGGCVDVSVPMNFMPAGSR